MLKERQVHRQAARSCASRCDGSFEPVGTRLSRIHDRRHYGCGSNPSEDDRTPAHSDSFGFARTYFCSTSETSAREMPSPTKEPTRYSPPSDPRS